MSPAQRSIHETIDNLTGCYTELEDLVATIHDDEWSVQSLCPSWSVRDVVVHLLTVERALLGWHPRSVEEPLPFQSFGQLMDEVEGWNVDRMATELADTLDARRSELRRLSDAQWLSECMSPVGPNTYQGFMDIRAFDFWVHSRDISTPLGRKLDHGGPAAEASADLIEASIGYIVGKRIGLPDAMSISFFITGEVTRDFHVEVDGRARKVDHLAEPTVTLKSDWLTFSQLACGRIDPQAAIDAEHISWSGSKPASEEWGDKAARSLRFTM